MERPRALEDAVDIKVKPWQLTNIVDPVQCRLVTLPESTDSSNKVTYLTFAISIGLSIQASFYQWVACFTAAGCSTPLYQHWHWHPGAWLQWCPKIMEMAQK